MSVSSDGNRDGAASQHNRAHLLGIPAELRNEILSLVLVGDEEIEIKKGCWPGVLTTCKQLREEGMKVFLGNNDFVAAVKGWTQHFKPIWDAIFKDKSHFHTTRIDASALTDWLGLIKGLPTEYTTTIRKIIIQPEGEVLDMQGERDEGGRTRIGWRPNFAFWNRLVLDIKDAGVRPRQVLWPGAPGCKERKPPEPLFSAASYILSQHVLTPLLRDHGMLDERCSPAHLVDRMQELHRQGRSEWRSHRPRVLTWESRTTEEGRAMAAWYDEWKAGGLHF